MRIHEGALGACQTCDPALPSLWPTSDARPRLGNTAPTYMSEHLLGSTRCTDSGSQAQVAHPAQLRILHPTLGSWGIRGAAALSSTAHRTLQQSLVRCCPRSISLSNPTTPCPTCGTRGARTSKTLPKSRSTGGFGMESSVRQTTAPLLPFTTNSSKSSV